jgi:hypothetical protein
MLRRFPFGMVFRTAAEDVRAIAVAHAKREPAYWLHRVVDP